MSKTSRPWFVFDNIEDIFQIKNSSKHVYRIISFDSLLQMLNETSNYLVPIRWWEDVYENFVMKEQYYRNGRKVPIHRMADRFYGQCWASKKSSDALWRIYSPDKKGIQIMTSLGKLQGIVNREIDKESFFLGKVDYYPQHKIDADLVNHNKLTVDQLTHIILQSLFVKRNSFSHESEYRLVYMSDQTPEQPEQIIKIPIEPLNFIESVTFDPRADGAYVDRCTKVLTDAFGYPTKRIKKSNLYSFKPIELEIE